MIFQLPVAAHGSRSSCWIFAGQRIGWWSVIDRLSVWNYFVMGEIVWPWV